MAKKYDRATFGSGLERCAHGRKMKVVLVDLGIGAYTIALANALADLVSLTVIQPERLAAPWLSRMNPKIKLIYYELPRIRDPRNLLAVTRLLRMIDDLRPDVLHMQEAINPWFSVLASLGTLPPTVTTIHDVARHPGEEKGAWLLTRTRKLMMRKSQAFIVHARVLKGALADDWGIPEGRIHVVPHGELGSLYLTLNGGGKCPTLRDSSTVLFFGRVLRYKGLGVLAAAMEIVRRSIPHARLLIAGRGDTVSRYLTGSHSRDGVEVIDRYIPDSEVEALFRRAGVLALPYLEASQSGVACLGMAMGTPIVATKIGGMAELIHDNVDGLLVPPADPQALANAIQRLIAHEDLRNQLAAAAAQRCRQDLAWQNIAQTTAHIYSDVIGLQRAREQC
jgi:glycosyltransferase involved in cell wall biosynthesis